MKKWRWPVRCAAFLIVLTGAVIALQGVLRVDLSRSFEHARGLKAEKPRSLDAVYIGSSNVHAFWVPPIAWQTSGIAVYNYSFDALPFSALQYLVSEARKTQPDAMYIINLNSLKSDDVRTVMTKIHFFADFMPLSLNKLRLIRYLAEHAGLTMSQRLELYLPSIRFHSRWDSLDASAFGYLDSPYKGAMYDDRFMTRVEDFSGDYRVYDTRSPIAEDTRRVFEALLDYCERERVNVLFVTVPQVISEAEQGRINLLADMAAERGFPCLDLLSIADEYGLDPRTDFYNAKHTNVHGARKVTGYLSDYLVEHCRFADKRGQQGWESWDAAAERYSELLDANLLPFDLEGARRLDTDIPALAAPKIDGRRVTVSWAAVGGAAGYQVYRKASKKADRSWRFVGETDSGGLTFQDDGLEPDTLYTYTVVPIREENGETLYGRYDFTGVNARTPER